MKVKLSYVGRTFKRLAKYRLLSLCMVVVIAVIVIDTIKLRIDFYTAKAYVDNYLKNHKLPVAPPNSQDRFDQLIMDSNLGINRKNISYAVLEEQDDVIVGSYDLALSGTYIDFLHYLNLLNHQTMLHKIHSLQLTVDSSKSILIKMKLDTLYDTK